MNSKNLNYVDLLKGEFQSRSLVNESYSLRAFSRDIGLSSSMLSEVLRGKRRLSPKKAVAVAKSLRFSQKEECLFIALVKSESLKSERLKKEGLEFLQGKGDFKGSSSLSLEGFKLMSDWYYYAILCAMELDQYDGNTLFISDYLGLEIELIDQCITTLMKLDLVEYKNKKYHSTKEDLTTTHDISSFALKKFHKQNLVKAIESIDKIAVEKRDITSITMSIDKEKLPEAKKIIAKFRRELSCFLESNYKNSVYNLCIQLFPLGGNNNEMD